jgi:hypothetical protein
MNEMRWMGWVVVLALLLSASAPAQAQLAKQGKFSGTVGWNLRAQMYQYGEGNIQFVGSNRGLFLNSAGKGFIHEASQICSWSVTLLAGQEEATGFCTLTDPEGDKAHFVFGRKRPANDDSIPGTLTFIDGTGKYKGIQGKAIYRPKVINFRSTPNGDHAVVETEGSSYWEGEYKLQ